MRKVSAKQFAGSRISKKEGNDHYLDPETGVFKNELDIRDEEKLSESATGTHQSPSFQKWLSHRMENLRELSVSDPSKTPRPIEFKIR